MLSSPASSILATSIKVTYSRAPKSLVEMYLVYFHVTVAEVFSAKMEARHKGKGPYLTKRYTFEFYFENFNPV